MATKKGLLAKSKKTTDISKKNPEDYLKEAYARIIVPETDGTHENSRDTQFGPPYIRGLQM